MRQRAFSSVGGIVGGQAAVLTRAANVTPSADTRPDVQRTLTQVAGLNNEIVRSGPSV